MVEADSGALSPIIASFFGLVPGLQRGNESFMYNFLKQLI